METPMRSNYEPTKRRYYETESVIDLPYLINAPRALSESEFKRRLPTSPYAQYMESFFRRRVQSLFPSLCTAQWFKDRYFSDEEYNVCCERVGRCIQLSGVSADKPLSELITNVKTGVPTATVLVSDGRQERDFKRTLFVVGEDLVPEDAIGVLQGSFDASIVDVSGVEIVSSSTGTHSQIKGLFREVVRYERRKFPHVTDDDIEKVVSTDTVECYTEFLRDKFYFCTSCCRKFDNQVEMLLNCSRHTQNDFCARNYDILSYPKSIEQLKNTIETLASHYSKTQQQNYMCKHCVKTFSNEEFVVTHLKTKHGNITQYINESNELMSLFLDRIDFFMFGIIFGTNVKSVPHYGTPVVGEHAVVYDIPCVFSGEIRLD